MSGSSESVDSQAPPVRSSHKPKRRRWITALVIAVSIVVAGLIWALTVTGWLGARFANDSPRPLQRQFRDLRLGPSFKLVAEEHSSNCFAGCRALDRYYTSDLTIEEACAEIGPKLAAWGNVDRHQPPPGLGYRCEFTGTRASFHVFAKVRKDTTVNFEPEITEPHQSVLLIELTDS